MKQPKPLTDESGEVRELTLEDMRRMVPFSELPPKLQSKLKQLKKMGRPVLAKPKAAISIRLDADVLEAIKATGDGWQTRVNETLRSQFIKRSHK
jgi:uncharacterized protein (DUF4415 family)